MRSECSAGIDLSADETPVCRNENATAWTRERSWRKPAILVLGALAALAVLAYLRSTGLPFISDDYYQITLAWKYGSASNWGNLILDPLYRCRATSIVLTYWTWRIFDLNFLAYKWSSIFLHVLNTWLVFGLGSWRLIGWRRAAVAAGFFAVYEGHQEAVIWYAALPELLVFFFVLLSFHFWVAWLQSGCLRHWHYLAALVCFGLALGSKESSVVAVPLMLLALAAEKRWRGKAILALAPMAGLAIVYAVLIHASRSEHLFYHDGTFSLSAPFVETIVISTGRLFWFWGVSSVVALIVLRRWETLRAACFAAASIIIALLPYSFLTYMPRVPSRHTYLASAVLALVVATAVLAVQVSIRHKHRWVLPALVAVIIVHNCGYIWTRKHSQYLKRAEATELLVRLAHNSPGPIYLRCFPYGPDIAQAALEVTDGGRSRSLVIGGKPPSDVDPPCIGTP